MKKRLFLLFLFFCFTHPCFSQTKEIQFRLVLTEKEAETIPFDNYIGKDGKEVSAGKEVLLSNKDIEGMSVSKNLSKEWHLLIKFTDAGKNRSQEVTEKYRNRQLAVIVDGKILIGCYTVGVMNTGQILIPMDSLNEGEELIKSLGFTPEDVKYQF